MIAGQQAVGPVWRDLGIAIALYIGFSAIGHLVWEIAQLPLYSLWHTASRAELAFAVLHCTAGDLLIAASVLVGSLVLLRASSWPRAKIRQVAALAIPLGVAYTAFSEWHNVYVRQSWGYDAAMPTLTIIGHEIGVAPLAQWAFVPAAVFAALALLRVRYLQSDPGASDS